MYIYDDICWWKKLNKVYGVPEDEKKASEYNIMTIKTENEDVLINYMLEKGDSVDFNKEKAKKYYKMDVDKGNPITIMDEIFLEPEQMKNIIKKLVNVSRKQLTWINWWFCLR